MEAIEFASERLRTVGTTRPVTLLGQVSTTKAPACYRNSIDGLFPYCLCCGLHMHLENCVGWSWNFHALARFHLIHYCASYCSGGIGKDTSLEVCSAAAYVEGGGFSRGTRDGDKRTGKACWCAGNNYRLPERPCQHTVLCLEIYTAQDFQPNHRSGLLAKFLHCWSTFYRTPECSRARIKKTIVVRNYFTREEHHDDGRVA